MEIIDNGVQFKFLKLYSVFFSVYTFLVYGITQKFESEPHKDLDFWAALALAIILILIQMFVIRDSVFKDETVLDTTLTEARINDSYKKRYEKFQEDITND
jgi:hypothetical protein